MQTFSNMQRSITYQNALSHLFGLIAFGIYSALSSIYLFLPPMFALLGFLFYRTLLRHDLGSLIVFSIMFLMLEAEKGYWFGSSILFFALISHYLMPKLEQTMRCTVCIKGIFVLLAYIGYWGFIWMINSVLLLQIPSLDWHILFYMPIEFALIAIFG